MERISGKSGNIGPDLPDVEKEFPQHGKSRKLDAPVSHSAEKEFPQHGKIRGARAGPGPNRARVSPARGQAPARTGPGSAPPAGRLPRLSGPPGPRSGPGQRPGRFRGSDARRALLFPSRAQARNGLTKNRLTTAPICHTLQANGRGDVPGHQTGERKWQNSMHR